MKELVNLTLDHQLTHTDTTFSKNENDIEFKELVGAKFHHGGSFKKDSPKWIVVHYTAVAGASAYSCTKSYSKTSRKVSTHFFCDSKDVYRVVDEKHIAWHVGSGKIPCPARLLWQGTGTDHREESERKGAVLFYTGGSLQFVLTNINY